MLLIYLTHTLEAADGAPAKVTFHIYLHCIAGGPMQKQQLSNAHVPVLDSIVQGRVVLIARGVHQRFVLQQQLHHCFVPVVTRLVLGGEGHKQ